MDDSVIPKDWQKRAIVAMSASELAMSRIDSLPKTSKYAFELKSIQEEKSKQRACSSLSLGPKPKDSRAVTSLSSGNPVNGGRGGMSRLGGGEDPSISR